jgi:hypothetical protein
MCDRLLAVLTVHGEEHAAFCDHPTGQLLGVLRYRLEWEGAEVRGKIVRLLGIGNAYCTSE